MTPYIAGATVLCCFDHRVRHALTEFLDQQQIRMPDMIVVAGGSKTLASPSSDSEREFIIEQIQLSLKLHGAKRIILINHSDCGAYGGLAAFQGNVQMEAQHHANELQKALTFVGENLPNVAVEAYFVDFEGIWKLVDGR